MSRNYKDVTRMEKLICGGRFVVAVELPGENAVPNRYARTVERETIAALREVAAGLEALSAPEQGGGEDG